MTLKELREELKKIYKEGSSWNGGKGPFTPSLVKYRELTLARQRVLYQLEEAMESGDKGEIRFNEILLELIT
jgi:hypothetical protein